VVNDTSSLSQCLDMIQGAVFSLYGLYCDYCLNLYSECTIQIRRLSFSGIEESKNANDFFPSFDHDAAASRRGHVTYHKSDIENFL